MQMVPQFAQSISFKLNEDKCRSIRAALYKEVTSLRNVFSDKNMRNLLDFSGLIFANERFQKILRNKF